MEKPESTEQQVDSKMSEVQGLQRKLDLLKHDSMQKSRHLYELDCKLNELSLDAKLPKTEDSPQMRHIRVLENRLDKAMIKYNEAQSIRKTYEAIVKRLKEERIGFDNQLAAIERTLKAQEKKILVQQRVEMNHRLEQREKMLKKQQELDKQNDKQKQEMTATTVATSNVSNDFAAEELQKVKDYEEA